MKMPVAVIKNWVDIISDDCMHFSDSQKEYVVSMAKNFDYEIWKDGIGCIGWLTMLDFDCKKKCNVLLLYCKPEYRGREFIPMVRRLEQIAKAEGAEQIVIGESVSGYKGNKFNAMFSRLGYNTLGYKKDL